MNNIVKQLQELNRKAFIFAKRQEYKIRGYIYSKQMTKKIDRFRDAVDCADWIEEFHRLSVYDAPDKIALNMYLREHFDDKYPRFIEIVEPKDDGGIVMHFFEMIYVGESLSGKYQGVSIGNFFNLQSKIFTYVNVGMPLHRYSDFKDGLIAKLARDKGITVEEMEKRFLK